MADFEKNRQYIKFCLYGFLKNLRFFDAFLLLFFLDNDISFSQIGILYAAREITINIFEIPSGIIADTHGRKNALLGAFLLYIIAFITFYFSAQFILLLSAMIVWGIGDAFRSGTHKGMIMDYLKINDWYAHKIAYYGHTRSWSQRGSAVSALLAGLLVFFSGNYRIVYLISIFPYLLNFINIYTYPDEINYSRKKKGKKRPGSRIVIRDFITVLSKKKVLEIVNSSALHASYLKAIKDYIQPLMVNIAMLLPFLATYDDKSRSGLTIGIGYFIIFLLTAYASKNAGKLSALKLNQIELKTLLLGFACGLISSILFHYDVWILSLLFFIAIYLVENIRKPILTGFLADQVPGEILTSVISAESFYKTISTAGLSLLIGFTADYYGIGIALLSVTLVLILITLLIHTLQASATATKHR